LEEPSLRPDSISIVVPVYNGAATLPELIERLASVLPELCGEFEAILVNDGSQRERRLRLNGFTPRAGALRQLFGHGVGGGQCLQTRLHNIEFVNSSPTSFSSTGIQSLSWEGS